MQWEADTSTVEVPEKFKWIKNLYRFFIHDEVLFESFDIDDPYSRGISIKKGNRKYYFRFSNYLYALSVIYGREQDFKEILLGVNISFENLTFEEKIDLLNVSDATKDCWWEEI
jgi:hypothetical protein